MHKYTVNIANVIEYAVYMCSLIDIRMRKYNKDIDSVQTQYSKPLVFLFYT